MPEMIDYGPRPCGGYHGSWEVCDRCDPVPPTGVTVPLHQSDADGADCLYCGLPSCEWRPMQRCMGVTHPLRPAPAAETGGADHA